MFSYLLTAPSLEKRYKVYCKTPFFREELSGYAMMLGETSKDELLDWGRQLGGCLSVAENLLIAKAIALFQNKYGIFLANSRTAFINFPFTISVLLQRKLSMTSLKQASPQLALCKKFP